jgi:hypothetical protein
VNAVTANLVAGGAMESLAAIMPAMDARLRVGRRFIVRLPMPVDLDLSMVVDGATYSYLAISLSLYDAQDIYKDLSQLIWKLP